MIIIKNKLFHRFFVTLFWIDNIRFQIINLLIKVLKNNNENGTIHTFTQSEGMNSSIFITF